MNCWICNQAEAATREHLAKASDLRAIFGKPTAAAPLYLSNVGILGRRSARRNNRVGSVKSDLLKFGHRICLACNSTLTQPYDYAWEHASQKLRDNTPRLAASGSFRANWLFTYDTREWMERLHLYFTKLFGCLVVEGHIGIDTTPFAEALRTGRPTSDLYLGFGHLPLPVQAAGGSDVGTAVNPDGVIEFASWIYHIDSLALNVLYAKPGAPFEALKTAWNPRARPQRLPFTDLSGEVQG